MIITHYMSLYILGANNCGYLFNILCITKSISDKGVVKYSKISVVKSFEEVLDIICRFDLFYL